MYIVSTNGSPISAAKLHQLEQERQLTLPEAYVRFLTLNGPGTYRGWFNIEVPDSGVLEPFAEEEFWEHNDASPITQQQIAECVSIGTTIDGDFLAVHSDVKGILWLPRHSEIIELYAEVANEHADYTELLDQIYSEKLAQEAAAPPYFEPWTQTRKHQFFHFAPDKAGYELPELARECKESFQPDFQIENAYTCTLFLQRLGGYIRFNYAYRLEVAVFYEEGQEPLLQQITAFLVAHNCKLLT
ncbi:hypothetical protein ASF12_00735 [Paenibacillus sp. Leaf72]|nr:hypothetical protein ASF12_00735 [Paenibacillus sp. Leaf72]